MGRKEKHIRLKELNDDIMIVNSYIKNKNSRRERIALENLRQLLIMNYLELKEKV